MKLAKIFSMVLGLATVKITNDPQISVNNLKVKKQFIRGNLLDKIQRQLSPHNFDIKKQLSTQILKDVQEIRAIRDGYNQHSEARNKQYDKKVEKISDCFVQTRKISDKWSEKKSILDLHECSLKNNYPNIQKLDDNWEEQIVERRKKGQLNQDDIKGRVMGILPEDLIVGKFEGKMSRDIDTFRRISRETGFNTEIKLKNSGAIFKRRVDYNELETNVIKISLDNQDIIRISSGAWSNGMANILIARSPIVKSKFSENHQDEFHTNLNDHKELNKGGSVIVEHLDNIANKLLDGDFKSQKKAVELLLEYKIIASMPFLIEDSLGTQFKNIVKINYLTEAIKERYPSKIDKDLKIPHIFEYHKFNASPFFKNPEIALTLLDPDKFNEIHKKQLN